MVTKYSTHSIIWRDLITWSQEHHFVCDTKSSSMCSVMTKCCL